MLLDICLLNTLIKTKKPEQKWHANQTDETTRVLKSRNAFSAYLH